MPIVRANMFMSESNRPTPIFTYCISRAIGIMKFSYVRGGGEKEYRRYRISIIDNAAVACVTAVEIVGRVAAEITEHSNLLSLRFPFHLHFEKLSLSLSLMRLKRRVSRSLVGTGSSATLCVHHTSNRKLRKWSTEKHSRTCARVVCVCLCTRDSVRQTRTSF